MLCMVNPGSITVMNNKGHKIQGEAPDSGALGFDEICVFSSICDPFRGSMLRRCR